MEQFEKALAKARRDRASNAPEAERPAPENNEPSARGHGSIPPAATRPNGKAKATKEPIVALEFEDPISDLFRMLRTQVLIALTKKNHSAFGVCSPRAGDGKTFVAANLAASIALSREYRVLLVDLDLRRPSVQNYFQLEFSPGITDFLAGQASLEKCVVTTSVDGLEILPAGRPIRNSSEALGSSNLTQSFAKLCSHKAQRIIVCDLPPLLSSDDALTFSAQLDAMLLVVQESKTRPGELQRSLDLLASSTLLGTVLNKSRYNNPFPYSTYDAHVE